MFRSSKIKIVMVIISVLVAFLAGALFLIYFSSYLEVTHKNKRMLTVYAKAYWQNGNPEGKLTQPPIPDGADDSKGDPSQNSSVFYSVAISDDGTIVSVDKENDKIMSDDTLVHLCQSLIKAGKNSGVKEHWMYYLEHENNCTLVVLMDNRVMSDNIVTLFRNTVIFGSLAILLLLPTSIYISHRIVRPLEDNFQKQKQFISDASHELKTPVAIIGTNAEMLEREIGPNKWISNILYENKQMGELVHQLLELARAESVAPAMNRLNFSRLVTGGTLPFECIAFENEQDLQLSIQEDLHVYGNEEQLFNVVSILLDNAITYSPKKKDILVTLKSDHHMAVLSVINEGEAIPKEKQSALFDRFYRLDSCRNGSSGHYGLGLAIVKATITSHNGKIAVNCRDNQVIFTITLPIVT